MDFHLLKQKSAHLGSVASSSLCMNTLNTKHVIAGLTRKPTSASLDGAGSKCIFYSLLLQQQPL